MSFGGSEEERQRMTRSNTSCFYGRTKELAWLKELFEDVAETRTPRLAVILAESGLGKSRLVQAFYQELTDDPEWDPRDVDYWPAKLQQSDTQLSVNPTFVDHDPKGLPKFMWFGVRWPDPDKHNVEERICRLPDLQEHLNNHLNNIYRLMPISKAVFRKAYRDDSPVETVLDELKGNAPNVLCKILGISVNECLSWPGANFVRAEGSRLASTYRDLAQNRDKSPYQAEQQAKVDAGEGLLVSINTLMRIDDPPPTILWLDDAQWIDPITLKFLSSLFDTAKRERWPILVIATHWEREWMQGRKEERQSDAGLAQFSSFEFGEGKKTETWELKSGEPDDLQKLILEHLPGATTDVLELLMEKADGNYLSMMEDIRELKNSLYNFVGKDKGKPLTPKAVEKIKSWDSDLERRVKQRFHSLAEDTQRILAMSGRIGSRFIAEVVTVFATKENLRNADLALSECIDPLVILSKPRPLIREFRNRAYHRIASEFFEDHLKEDSESGLLEVLVNHLASWTNASFGAKGNLLPSPFDQDLAQDEVTAPESSFMALQPIERLELLTMAVEELPLLAKPNWSEPNDQAAVRARCFLVSHLASEGLWSRCLDVGKGLAEVDWMSVPNSVLSRHYLGIVGDRLHTAGALNASYGIFLRVLSDQRKCFKKDPSDELEVSISNVVSNLAEIERQQEKFDSAFEKHSEALAIRRRLAEKLTTHDLQELVAESWHDLACIEELREEFDSAYKKQSEALTIHRHLADELDTPFNHRLVSDSLSALAEIERQREEFDSAYEKHSEALTIRRRLADELLTPDLHQHIAVSLSRLVLIEERRGNLDSAYQRALECLEIDRRAADDRNTLEYLDIHIHTSVADYLTSLADKAEQQGELDLACRIRTKALEIRRHLAAD